jgi:hypothetical protein
MTTKNVAMRTIHNFATLTASQYTNRTKYYKTKGEQEVKQFWDWVANGYARYLETGDISHLNNMVAGALAVQRYRAFTRVTKALSCHKFDKDTKQFTGKIDKDKKESLCKADIDAGCEVWEVKLAEYIGKEDDHQNDTPKKDWSAEAAIVQLITKAGKEGVGLDELSKAFAAKVREAAASSNGDAHLTVPVTTPARSAA